MAELTRRSSRRSRRAEKESGEDRGDARGKSEARVPSRPQTASGHCCRAGRGGIVQRMPLANSSRTFATAEARRSRSLRRLPSHPLSGERHLKVTAFVDGACRGNPGPASYGVYMKTSGGEIIEVS